MPVTLPPVGAFSNPALVESAFKTHLESVLAAVRELQPAVPPPGAIFSYGGAVLPAGFLWCHGGTVSRTTYAALFAAIGTAYGVGDGTTFGVPNLKGRVPLCLDPAVSTANTLGETGGQMSVTPTFAGNTLTAHGHNFVGSPLPAHYHQEGVLGDGQTTLVDGVFGGDPTATTVQIGTVAEFRAVQRPWTSPNGAGTPVGAIDAQPAGTPTGTITAVPTVPPYLTVEFIIKT
jgi:microcystin-dependent protein